MRVLAPSQSNALERRMRPAICSPVRAASFWAAAGVASTMNAQDSGKGEAECELHDDKPRRRMSPRDSPSKLERRVRARAGA